MIAETESELYIQIKPYYEFVKLTAVMPSMTKLNSAIVLAETGINMDIYDDVKHLCSWYEHSPSSNESSEKKSVRIAKTSAYLKPILVQCVLATVKSKKQPFFAIKYGRMIMRI
jgi:transposase